MTDREKLIELIFKGEDTTPCARNPEFECDGIKCFSCEREAIADYLLNNGVTFAKDTDVPSKWISVEDEKPKRRGDYFVAYKFEGSDMRFFGEAFWHDDCSGNGYVEGEHFSNEGVEGMYVTHWMHIPKLPVPDPQIWRNDNGADNRNQHL